MRISTLLAVLLLLAACARVPSEQGSIEVLFCTKDDCVSRLVSLINASAEVKCALYNVNVKDVVDALAAKNAAIVVDNNNFGNVKGKLANVKTDDDKGLMHDKFCIFDRRIVWTGSLNPTVENLRLANNVLIINSSLIAENYLDEFEELWNGIYGGGSFVRYPVVRIGNVTVENYFCPEDNCKSHLLELLKTAKERILFMTADFTDNDVGDLLANAKVPVKGIFGKSQGRYSEFEKLKNVSVKAGIHHKVFVVDDVVWTGSFNPTKGANERNDENVVVLKSGFSDSFIKEFNSLFES